MQNGERHVKGESIEIEAFTLISALNLGQFYLNKGVRMITWPELPNRIIRAEMAKRGASYADLVARLARIGVVENERSLRNKVARGTFSATFLLQCLVALGVMGLDLSSYELPPASDPGAPDQRI
jgi:hypothetical protein